MHLFAKSSFHNLYKSNYNLASFIWCASQILLREIAHLVSYFSLQCTLFFDFHTISAAGLASMLTSLIFRLLLFILLFLLSSFSLHFTRDSNPNSTEIILATYSVYCIRSHKPYSLQMYSSKTHTPHQYIYNI